MDSNSRGAVGPELVDERQQARRMVEMEVTEHNVGHAGKLDPKRSGVVDDGVGVPTRVEQNASPINFNQCGQPPLTDRRTIREVGG